VGALAVEPWSGGVAGLVPSPAADGLVLQTRAGSLLLSPAVGGAGQGLWLPVPTGEQPRTIRFAGSTRRLVYSAASDRYPEDLWYFDAESGQERQLTYLHWARLDPAGLVEGRSGGAGESRLFLPEGSAGQGRRPGVLWLEEGFKVGVFHPLVQYLANQGCVVLASDSRLTPPEERTELLSEGRSQLLLAGADSPRLALVGLGRNAGLLALEAGTAPGASWARIVSGFGARPAAPAPSVAPPHASRSAAPAPPDWIDTLGIGPARPPMLLLSGGLDPWLAPDLRLRLLTRLAGAGSPPSSLLLEESDTAALSSHDREAAAAAIAAFLQEILEAKP